MRFQHVMYAQAAPGLAAHYVKNYRGDAVQLRAVCGAALDVSVRLRLWMRGSRDAPVSDVTECAMCAYMGPPKHKDNK